MKKIVVLACILLSLTVVAVADIPKTINFQGRLTDSEGTVLADGTHSVAFRLWTDPTSTDQGTFMVWNDSYSIATKNGYFNVELGSGLNTLASLDFNTTYYLDMQVGTDSFMTPRQKLNSVPYALNVATNGLPGYLFYKMITLTVGSGTYVPSTGVRAVMVECVGGGGGGGSATQSATTSSAAGGGSGAGYCRKFITTLDSGYSYTVGAKGSGGSNGDTGTDGGDTIFNGSGVAITAGKGRGGYGVGSTAWTSTGMVSNTVGGAATGGDINIKGQASMYGIQIDLNMGSGGAGGNSYLGFGGHGQYGSGTGDGTGYGSGGGGAKTTASSSDQTGGDGTDGVIIIWEYK